MTSGQYDLLIPIELHPTIGFSGDLTKRTRSNNEIDCAVLDWPATFHVTEEHRYLVVHRLVEPRHYGAEPEGSVIVELQLDRPRRTVERLLSNVLPTAP